jgi:hypothetical protein
MKSKSATTTLISKTRTQWTRAFGGSGKTSRLARSAEIDFGTGTASIKSTEQCSLLHDKNNQVRSRLRKNRFDILNSR